MKSLGIDFGERRIGLAISDAEGRWAMPLATIERRSDAAAVAAIATLAREHDVAALVVGEPRRPADGAETAASRRARGFGERLAAATSLPVEWVDESLTSREAAERLRAAGTKRRDRATRVDAIAAQILLQEGLDRRNREPG